METQVKQQLGPNQEKWLKALESGEYKQGLRALHMNTVTLGDRFCCLGVGCMTLDVERKKDSCILGGLVFGVAGVTALAPLELLQALALRSRGGAFSSNTIVAGVEADSLVTLNDSGVSFQQIAAFCREHPELVFTEPR